MVKAKISSPDLVLKLEGWDRFWSFKREVIIKLKNIRSIRKANKKDTAPWLRVLGTAWPGLITAGTYYGSKGRKEFWCTHHKDQGVLLELENENHTRVVFDLGSQRARLMREIESLIRA